MLDYFSSSFELSTKKTSVHLTLIRQLPFPLSCAHSFHRNKMTEFVKREEPILLWDIIEFEVMSHVPFCTVLNFGLTCHRLANRWKSLISHLPHLVIRNLIDARIRQFTRISTFRSVFKWPNVSDEGLSLLTNLTNLHLNSECISDNGIRTLTRITSIRIDKNSAITCGGLRQLPLLTSLSLAQPEVDIAHFESFSRLTFLEILNEASIESLPLSIREIYGNPSISDSALSPLKDITYLVLKKTSTVWDATLQIFTRLSYLSLSGNQIITDEGISSRSNLCCLDLGENNTITNRGLVASLSSVNSGSLRING